MVVFASTCTAPQLAAAGSLGPTSDRTRAVLRSGKGAGSGGSPASEGEVGGSGLADSPACGIASSMARHSGYLAQRMPSTTTTCCMESKHEAKLEAASKCNSYTKRLFNKVGCQVGCQVVKPPLNQLPGSQASDLRVAATRSCVPTQHTARGTSHLRPGMRSGGHAASCVTFAWEESYFDLVLPFVGTGRILFGMSPKPSPWLKHHTTAHFYAARSAITTGRLLFRVGGPVAMRSAASGLLTIAVAAGGRTH